MEGFLANANLTIDKDEINELVEDFRRKPTSHIRAAINSASLRYRDKCNADQILDVSYFVSSGRMPNKEEIEVDINGAIHEAGHATYLYFLSKTMDYGRIYFNAKGGFTASSFKTRTTMLSEIEDIRCCLAGLVAEEVCLHHHDYGSSRDLGLAHRVAYNLISTQGLKGVKLYCNARGQHEKSLNISQARMSKMENTSARFMHKQYKIMKKVLKRKKKQIEALASFLMEHKKASKKGIEIVLSGN